MARNWRILFVTLALLISSCGGSDDDAAGTSVPESTPSTTAPDTTTTTEVTTTTSTTTTEVTTTPSTTAATTTPPVSTSSDAPTAEGSGCQADASVLPDGRWYGYVDAATADEVSFDLACWFTGENAVVAAAEDGEESPPPNDYYVRNQQSRTRSVPVAPSIEVVWLPNPGTPDEESIDYGTWVADSATRGYQPGVWIDVADGAIVKITEQYVP